VAAARGLKDALPALPYASAVYGVASLVLLPFAVVLGVRAGLPAPRPAAAVLAMALIPTLIGHTIVQRAAREAPPALVALVCPGETLGAIAIGAIFMRTPPTLREGIGAAIVLAGATLAILGQRPVKTATTGA
jgi:drug/metabolite transporter (DMT)-like permease